MAIDDALTAIELLALKTVGDNRLRSTRNQDNRAGFIFGGQPLCQALAAARTTVERWPAHNLSAVFLRGGLVAEPVDYQVEILRDGRSFASRRVLATQRGRPIFDLLCSFQAPEVGVVHSTGGVGGIAAPESLLELREFCAANADRLAPALNETLQKPFPVEIRLVDPEAALFGNEPGCRRDYWFRMPTARSVSGHGLHQCLLAFSSDYWLAGTASGGHRPEPGQHGPSVASLNHSLWFHAPVDAADWLLYRTDSPWAGGGRGLARGLIYDRAGTLIASAAQEISLRFT